MEGVVVEHNSNKSATHNHVTKFTRIAPLIATRPSNNH